MPQPDRNPAKRPRPTGDPTVATLLAWVIPGAGHLYLGSVGVGLVGFVVVAGLYALGLQLTDGMVWEYLDPELRTRFAPVLSPEAGNLGGLVFQMQKYGYGPGYPRLMPDTMRLGGMLTAVSGIANILMMVHVHLLARTGDVRASAIPTRHVGLTWLVPGLGHVAQGRVLRGAIVFVLLVGLMVAGTLLADASNLSRERHFYYWSGQFLLGLPALAAEWGFGQMRITGRIPYVEAGLVFGCAAGLLNVLAMIDAYAWSEAKVLGLDPRDRGHSDSDAGKAAEATPAGMAGRAAETVKDGS